MIAALFVQTNGVYFGLPDVDPWDQTRDVWAYLVARELPIHPAYACTMDGLLDPDRIRVASLGGRRGDGMGRTEWEQRYYGEELRGRVG